MRHVPLLLTLALLVGGCRFTPRPDPDPCVPNPCTDAHRGVCLKDGPDRFQCACDEGFVQRPSGVCEAITVANCPEHPGDGAEPDDCLSKAKPFALDEQVRTQTIAPVGDYDYFRIEAAAKRIYAIGVNAEGSPVYPRLDLFDPTGRWQDSVEYPTAPDDPGYHQRPTLFFKNRGLAAAPFHVRMMHSPRDPSVGTGAYSIQLTSPGVDDHADTLEEGPMRIASEPVNSPSLTVHGGVLEYPLDRDLFLFQARASVTYAIDYRGETPPGPPAVAVYPVEGFATALPVVRGQARTVTFTVPAAGDYVLVVTMHPQRFQQQRYRFVLVH